jgi:hypothetical protein
MNFREKNREISLLQELTIPDIHWRFFIDQFRGNVGNANRANRAVNIVSANTAMSNKQYQLVRVVPEAAGAAFWSLFAAGLAAGESVQLRGCA